MTRPATLLACAAPICTLAIPFAAGRPGPTSGNAATVEATIRTSTDWALATDRAAPLGVVAHDTDFFCVHPNSSRTVLGYEAFVEWFDRLIAGDEAEQRAARLAAPAEVEQMVDAGSFISAGVAVSRQGRLFLGVPRWGDVVAATVVEVRDRKAIPVPDAATLAPADRHGQRVTPHSDVRGRRECIALLESVG
jgi:hypothetical protein